MYCPLLGVSKGEYKAWGLVFIVRPVNKMVKGFYIHTVGTGLKVTGVGHLIKDSQGRGHATMFLPVIWGCNAGFEEVNIIMQCLIRLVKEHQLQTYETKLRLELLGLGSA